MASDSAPWCDVVGGQEAAATVVVAEGDEESERN